MISYETYKILHIFTLFMVISAMGGIIAEGRWIPNRSFKIAVGVLSFLVFVGGMGLIARLGFKHTEPFPLWVIVKIASWIILNIAIVALFKVQKKEYKTICALVSFMAIFTAVYSAITKLS
jgi:uncharacterized membrane protein SirB2